jgi:hypothetical protein
MKWSRRKKRAGSEPDRAWQMRRDAPGALCWEQSVALHGGPPLRLRDVSLGRGKYACVAGERNIAGEQAEELTQRRQISVKLPPNLRASVLTPPARHAYTPAGGVRHF